MCYSSTCGCRLRATERQAILLRIGVVGNTRGSEPRILGSSPRSVTSLTRSSIRQSIRLLPGRLRVRFLPCQLTGCSAVWSAHSPWKRVVAGSNPAIPMKYHAYVVESVYTLALEASALRDCEFDSRHRYSCRCGGIGIHGGFKSHCFPA